MEKYPIHFAPLQGYTEDVYRRLHNEVFGSVDTYYTPFVRLEHGEPRSKDMRDVRPEFNAGVNVVPQVIASDEKELSLLIDRLLPLGYKRIDINMGCPFPLQTRHGRGAGLLQKRDVVQDIAAVISRCSDVSFSVKMRLGLVDRDEWREILPVLNDTPLQHVTVHPRIASQQYKGEVDMQSFAELLGMSQHPVIYNGDITCVGDINRLESEFGDALHAVMIGRGLLARPSLAWEYVNDVELPDNELLQKIYVMHDKLHEHYSRIIPGEAQQLSKLRTFWDYMEPILGRKQWKKIMKAGNMKNYLKVL